MSYTIITDSACDLPQDIIDSLNIKVTPFKITVDDLAFDHYPDARELSFKEFYDRIRAGSLPTTSAVNPLTWMDAIEEEFTKGLDVFIIGFSSALSITLNNAVIAAEEMRTRYPERQVEVVDSLCASAGQGFLVRLAAEKQIEGLTLSENVKYIEDNKLNICHWVLVDDLSHLRRGGRIPAATAIVGSALGIKPIIKVDNEGRLVNCDKTRGRKKGIQYLLDRLGETIKDPASQSVLITNADCFDEVQEMANTIKSHFGVKDVVITPLGPVPGAHTGPGTIALFFFGDHR